MSQANFDEIRQILAAMPVVDEAAQKRYWGRDAVLTKPPRALGRLEEIGAWYVGWKAEYPAQFIRPRVSVYAGNHGVAAQGVSAFPPEVTGQMVQNFRNGGAAVNQLAMLHDADLKIHEMALDQATKDFSLEPAMSEQECAEALAYGMMDAEEGVDILCLGEMGIANSTSGAALCCALYGGSAEQWVGRGTGIDDATLVKKTAVINAALTRHKDVVERGDGLEILRTFGGLELAGIVGAVIAARVGRIPVLLDGYACTAAAAILCTIRPDALDHCLVAHRSKEPGHIKLLEKINKEPLLDYNMGLGEASGAALALGIVKASIALHNGMASFDEAAVSEKD